VSVLRKGNYLLKKLPLLLNIDNKDTGLHHHLWI
jgi:hypothetical protein